MLFILYILHEISLEICLQGNNNTIILVIYNITSTEILDIWDKYTDNFESFWLASAFKGATGPCMYVTDIDHHSSNHQAWLRVVREQLLHQKGLQGFCITGWQRYVVAGMKMCVMK